MDSKKEFYRKAYYDVCDKLNKKAIVSLTGPRQVGKTFAMKQLQKNFGGEYYNFKTMQTDKSDEVLDRIYTVVGDNEKANIYLDEITYLDDFEHCLASIAEAATLTIGSAKYHIVITGSQQIYIENAMSIAFGARAGMARMDFISFTEYYDYIHCTSLAQSTISEINSQISEDDYLDYLFNNSEFNCMGDGVEVYLKSCLDETIQSHTNSFFKNNAVQVDEINMQNLKAVAYTIIVNLIDQISAKQIAEYPFLLKKVRTYYNQRAVSKEAVSKIRKEDFDAAVNASVLKNYKLDNRMSTEKLLDCVRFLYQCKLINITVYNPESESRLDSFFNGIYEKWNNADAFFTEYSVTFAYPHFFVGIMKDICENLDIDKKDVFFGALLGALVECTLKGQLAIRYGQPLHAAQKYNEHGVAVAEVDYFNDMFAMEISIRNKTLQETHFTKFDFGNRKKILTTKDISKNNHGIICIPYYTCQVALENNITFDAPTRNLQQMKMKL